MKKELLSFGIVFILTGQIFSQCIADWGNVFDFTFDGKSYKIVKERKNWATAATCAVELGGYLVEINSQEEQEAVFDAILNGAQVSPTYTSVSNGGGIAYIWIGANDMATEGTWIWNGNNDENSDHFWTGNSSNGAAVENAYFNWGGTSTGVCKEPDNYNNLQHCAGIGLRGWPSGTTSLGIPGEWNDIYCASQLYFVVEYDSLLSVNAPYKNSIEIFPNPVKDRIHLKGIENIAKGQTTMRIFNILGTKVFEQEITEETIDISHIGYNGLLFVELIDRQGQPIYTTKIMNLK